MMTLLPLMLAAAAPAVPAAALPPMPEDLSQVREIRDWPGRRVSPQWSEDVARQYRKGHCTGSVNYEGSQLLQLDVLFLLSPEGKPLRIAPVNVRCPPVEQYVSNRILGTLRNSFPKPGGSAPLWYRSQVRFLWSDAP